ncbi:uncharacterized protein EI90DRAFT_2213542 [Cantharellus anzutake]|uniref:uncharacterized protein n=1 Tax=Cantharellus anzutake TaxID=1750568 RepID=UPI0019055D0F|nr:uncharacterized protein EI90DRAFT_2213542 [Cantharellus anzutake]KAF8324850.1 hypothetical protein EI90DRAFT_2213542 [Cantharellus anzutake]
MASHHRLRHNDIGDYGSIALLEYLCSDAGRRIELLYLDFNGTGLGDIGLRAVSSYIRGNPTLEVLHLQNNQFTGSQDVIADFTEALNESRVSGLSLAGNPSLSDNLSKALFPNLTTPHLRTLDISLVSLTSDSAPFIINYIQSPRSRHLRELRCNGNRLGPSLRNIVRAIRDQNFSLERLEFFANSGAGVPLANGDDRPSDEEGDDPDLYPLTAMWATLKRCRERNTFLRSTTETEALRLLVVTRCMLFGSHRTREQVRTVTWGDLPAELKLEILSYIAPNLSPSQRIHVTSYAADATTLPPLDRLPTPGKARPSKDATRSSWLHRMESDHFDVTNDTLVRYNH